MDDAKLAACFEAADNEFQALRIGLKILTAALSATMPNGEIAKAFEDAADELKQHPDTPERVAEYIGEMAAVARKAVLKE